MVALSGGTKLVSALTEMSQSVSKAAIVNVGFLEGATYPDGTPVALVAAIQEFGAPSRGIPPRPFFRQMIAEHGSGWPKIVADLLKANDFDAHKTLAMMGEGIKGQLQQAVADFLGAPLAPATIARKGNDKQLVDSGHMLQSVDYKVE